MKRTVWMAVIAFAAMVGLTVAYVLTGENPVIKMSQSDNVIKIEAAGVNYAGWPDMSVSVNGNEVGTVKVETKQRKMFTVDVPADAGTISSVEIKFPNSTDCRKGQFSYESACTDRKLIVRKVFLNEQQLENGEASGDRNTAFSLQSSEGGIAFKVEG